METIKLDELAGLLCELPHNLAAWLVRQGLGKSTAYSIQAVDTMLSQKAQNFAQPLTIARLRSGKQSLISSLAVGPYLAGSWLTVDTLRNWLHRLEYLKMGKFLVYEVGSLQRLLAFLKKHVNITVVRHIVGTHANFAAIKAHGLRPIYDCSREIYRVADIAVTMNRAGIVSNLPAKAWIKKRLTSKEPLQPDREFRLRQKITKASLDQRFEAKTLWYIRYKGLTLVHT